MMKKESLPLLLAVLLVPFVLTGCYAFELASDTFSGRLPFGKIRGEVMGWHLPFSSAEDEGGLQDSLIIYVSTVEYPSGYDWRSDTLNGRSGAQLVLYKNGREQFRISADSDGLADVHNHHVEGGHLYSFKTAGEQTLVTKDGQLLYTISEKEYIKGMLVLQDSLIYTLGAIRGQGGYRYRLNGQLLASSNTGTIQGQFDDFIYPRSGALYQVGRHIYFSFKRETAGIESLFIVEDAQEAKVEGNGTLPIDAQMTPEGLAVLSQTAVGTYMVAHSGKEWMFGGYRPPFKLTAPRLFKKHRDVAVLANLLLNDQPACQMLYVESEDPQGFKNDQQVLSNGIEFRFLESSDSLGVYLPGQQCVWYEPGCPGFWLALTPLRGKRAMQDAAAEETDEGGTPVSGTSAGGTNVIDYPVVTRDGEVVQRFKINGYISGLYIIYNKE